MPGARTRRRWATRIIVVWAQVFVVLPAVHLHEHRHAHEQRAHVHDAHHAETAPHGHGHTHSDAARGDHADHDAHSAAHLNAAILPIAPRLLSDFICIPAERPLRAAPSPLDLAHPGHGWTPRGPPA